MNIVHCGESSITKGRYNIRLFDRTRRKFPDVKPATTPQRWVHKHVQKKRGRATVRAALGFLIGHEAEKRGIDTEESL